MLSRIFKIFATSLEFCNFCTLWRKVSCDLTTRQDGESKEEGLRSDHLDPWRTHTKMDQDRSVGGEVEGGGEGGGGGDGEEGFEVRNEKTAGTTSWSAKSVFYTRIFGTRLSPVIVVSLIIRHKTNFT